MTSESGKGVVGPTSGSLWSIILAGGEGTRLRPLIERIHHDARPKQFAILTGYSHSASDAASNGILTVTATIDADDWQQLDSGGSPIASA